MSDAKLFAGPRIRRARSELGLTQAAMAGKLGISPSYLNLIERNQRPLTAQVLLKIATHYRLDLGELQREGGSEVAGLREAFADPLLSGEITGERELIDMADTVPNASAGVVKLYRAYREALDRLSELSGMLSAQGVAAPHAAAQLPIERFRALVEPEPYHHPAIDEAAEAFAARLPRRGEKRATIAEVLEAQHGLALRMLPASAMPLWHLRNDRHTRRLFMSEALSPGQQLIALAGEAFRLTEPDLIAAAVDEIAGQGESNEVRRLVRAHLVAYAGHALAMPYRGFGEEAMRMKYDAGALAAHFSVDFGHSVRRMVSLQRINASAPPFFMMVVDGMGHMLERLGARGFPAARFGGACTKLPVFDLAGRPGESRVRGVELADGTRFVTVSHGIAAQPHGHARPMPRRAVLLGIDAADAEATVYSGTAAARDTIAVGLGCRVCERQGCPVRAEPAITRPAGMDEWTIGATPWDFQ